jgi:very-short-patch-repair endonuclease
MDESAAPLVADKPSSLKAQLDRGRTELLDLSSRNRLIHLPRKSKTAKNIEIVDELSSEIHRLLVGEGKAFTFVAGRHANGSADIDDEDELETSELSQPEDDPVDGRGVAQRHSDTKLQTRLTSEGLQKRLLTLHYDAKTLQEEQGVNILFLAVGMLKWFEDSKSEVERFAPLILIPVALERGTAAEKFRLRWLQEDPSPNLSLGALLKRQFGIALPDFVDGDGDGTFDPSEYMARVAAAVSAQPRWEVLRDDIVLGFFSFAKFLMYRDLDPALWPKGAGLEEHAVVGALLGDGFPPSEPMFGEDDPIDPHIGPEALIHIVDADSSQTAAIHEVRHGRHLVIQGPPGTGKSQTIANVIAAAVADGKKVLFVAEKMAALDVVKMRLDRTGVGDICLELHSNKANKRAVLEEIRRTWDLGKPNGGADPALVRQLEQYRDTLNGHVARFHGAHEPSRFTAYQAIGHLVRLRASGQPPAKSRLEGPQSWSRADKDGREMLLKRLVERVEDIGLPSAHPWRGVGLEAIMPMHLDRLVDRIEALAGELDPLLTEGTELAGRLSQPPPATFASIDRLLAIGRRIAVAPEMPSDSFSAPCWAARTPELADLLAAGELHAQARSDLSGVMADAAWDTDVKQARQNIATYGAGWLRWLNGDYKKADSLFRSILAKPAPKSLDERLKLLDQLIAAQKAAAELARDEALGREAFGTYWRRERSEWPTLRGVIDWMQGNDAALSTDIRTVAASITDRSGIDALCQRIGDRRASVERELEALVAELKLGLAAAFAGDYLSDIDLPTVLGRLGEWVTRREDLSKWIAYETLAAEGRSAGLGMLVARVASGALDVRAVVSEFDMAYYEALLTAMAEADPEIARFDGNGHSRHVQEFRDLDEKRIRLARLEVAAAHHAGLPSQNGGAGPLGVLRGEFARKRGHLPIRQLMKKAGAAVQAIKPVFMMSPLSVAQFLEPGAVHFDMLVIDEASQIQPVDALGAIARCNQIVIVGDDRQLPPTRFFDKMIAGGDDDDDESDSASIGDIESVLGLCVSKGLPQRMLRWHYRSRHQSLIAVSNSQFYDNRLFIVPSPYTQQAGMGLRFNHIADGTFDSGKTATNEVEAKAVAAAVIRHARDHADLSLGVAAFSTKQRRAILDEVERLRRLNPEVEAFFSSSHAAEPFFVKNLENVQGDERDVIFISVGYGRNAQGYMSMNFGPLNRDGGERRLNVLISRAKRRCEVFSSITDEDIDLERAKGKGVLAFKLFLHFARTGKLSIGTKSDREHDSVFEEQVAIALQARGYDVHPQVGLAGFFIDLAVADFERPGRYVIGIECDGAPYHSSRSARDRDRLRQAVLEDHGWTIHRIWSTDWFHRPQEQLEKTVAAIEAAKSLIETQDGDATQRGRAVPIEIITVEREHVVEVGLQLSDTRPDLAEAYREAAIAVPLHLELHEVPTGTMADLVRQVVEIEGPIHTDEIVTRIRSLWGLKRAGGRIQDSLERAIRTATSLGMMLEVGKFYRLASSTPKLRDRSAVGSPSLRKPEMLPPEEIIAGAVAFVAANLGATLA